MRMSILLKLYSFIINKGILVRMVKYPIGHKEYMEWGVQETLSLHLFLIAVVFHRLLHDPFDFHPITSTYHLSPIQSAST